GERRYRSAKPKLVRCAEPSPDALVATQSVLSASANAQNIGTSGAGGSAALAAKTAESAASLGFRDSSIQMLRDSYFRLCEAYMTGVLSDKEYGHMVENADTYLAVASALQIMGSNPVAPGVAISSGGAQGAALPQENLIASTSETTGQAPGPGPKPKDAKSP